jgi:transmembrane sensor
MTEPGQTTPAESRDAIEARAADFLHRRRVHRWSEADQVELNAWLDESTFHRVAYLRLVAGEALIEKVAELRAPTPRRLISNRRLRFMMPFLASAVSLGLIAVLGIAAERYFLQPADRTYSTEVGGRTLLSFADRTQIELDTDTVLHFRMTGEERTVWLEKGEAWFHVSHDASRPFNVIVGRHRITDLGTEFLVRSASDGMEVALLKGRAALSTEGAQTATLAPGDDAIATAVSMTVTRKTQQELADALAWRRGVLVFRNTTLADAVREFDRYNATRIVIADPSIAELKFSAEIKTENYEDFLNIAQTLLKLRVDREGNDILISRAEGKTKRAVRATHSQ